MDKLKAILGKLKKHHFWVLTGLVVVLALTGWHFATSRLAEEYAANKTTIKGKFDGLTRITAVTNHPNESFEKRTDALTTNLKKDVQKAWTLVYADQKSKVLKWPEKLGEEFLDWIDDPDHYREEIPEDFREMYLNYIEEEFQRLLEIVDARPYWDQEEDDVGGGSGRRRRDIEGEGPSGRLRPHLPKKEYKEYKVIWDKRNQQAIDETLKFPLGPPDSMTVRFCQENLWVYHALLDAIAEVNEGTTGQHNAKIKQIISLSIGQDASELVKESLAPGKILLPDGAAGQPGTATVMRFEEEGRGGGGPPASSMREADEGSLRGGIAPGAGGPGGKSLEDKRYVAEDGIPIAAGTPTPAEFKRMPILMQLFMDQRKIADLLVRLANSPLPVEIRQLRINTKMPGFTNPRPMMYAAGGDPGGAYGARGRPATFRPDPAFEEASQNPYDLAVELHGIIYIFNPPDKALSVAEVEGEAVATPAQAEPPVAAEAPVRESTEEPAQAEAEASANGEAEEGKSGAKEAAAQAAPEEEQKAPDEKVVPKKPAAKPEDDAPFGAE